MKKLGLTLAFSTSIAMFSCNSNQNGTANSWDVSSTQNSITTLSSYPSKAGNLRISLTDAPSRELKSVFVNVDHAELFVKGRTGKEGRLIVAQNLGLVDLMSLRNGVLLPLQDLDLPAGTEISAIRLILKENDNHSIKSDDSRCEMKTPSGQQSGIKIKLAQSFTLEQDQIYSMVLDFDAEKSVVVKGNGDCLLKPVLKLLTVTKTSNSNEDAENKALEDSEETHVTDGNDSNTCTDASCTDDNDSGFEAPTTDGTVTEPPVIPVDGIL